MTSRNRIFTPEFLALKCFPNRDDLLPWLATERAASFRKEWLSHMRQGRSCSANHMASVMGYLRAPENLKTPESIALHEYLERKGIATPEKLTDFEILSLVSVEDANPFMDGIDLLLKIFRLSDEDKRGFRPCRRDELPAAARYLFVEAGRHIEGKRLAEIDAIKVTESVLGLSLEDYAARKQLSLQISPCSCLVQSRRAKIQCMTSAVPVTQAAYERLRSGVVGPSTLQLEDVVERSTWIMIEGFAMRPLPGIAGYHTPSLSLGLAAMMQYACLTDVRDGTTSNPLRFLASPGNQSNERILQLFGYKRLGVRLAGTPFPLMECVHQRLGTLNRDSLAYGAWHALQWWVRHNHSFG